MLAVYQNTSKQCKEMNDLIHLWKADMLREIRDWQESDAKRFSDEQRAIDTRLARLQDAMTNLTTQITDRLARIETTLKMSAKSD